MTVGGVDEVLFWLFETLFLMLSEGNVFATKQNKASKDTFSLIHVIFKSKVCTQYTTVPECVTYYLNGHKSFCEGQDL